MSQAGSLLRLAGKHYRSRSLAVGRIMRCMRPMSASGQVRPCSLVSLFSQRFLTAMTRVCFWMTFNFRVSLFRSRRGPICWRGSREGVFRSPGRRREARWNRALFSDLEQRGQQFMGGRTQHCRFRRVRSSSGFARKSLTEAAERQAHELGDKVEISCWNLRARSR
jgi:hypothetical protein